MRLAIGKFSEPLELWALLTLTDEINITEAGLLVW